MDPSRPDRHRGIHTRRRLLAGGAGALGAGMLGAGRADAQLPNPVEESFGLGWRMPHNVKDFGATGDGSTDDTGAIQLALDAGAGGGVFLPPGRYAIGVLDVPSGTDLFGAGFSSVLVVQPSAVPYPLRILPAAEDVHLRDFAVDGNKTAIAAAGQGWDPDRLNGGPAGIVIADGIASGCRRIYVERLRVFDSFRLGIVFESVVDGAIRDCSIEGNNRDGITLYHDTKNVTVRGNTIVGCADDHIAINSENVEPFGHLCEGIVVTENTIVGPSPRGKGPGITVRGGNDVVIANNVIRDVSQAAIKLETFQTAPLTDLVVSANAIHRSGEGGSAEKIGISVHNAGSHVRGLSIVGNLLRDTRETAIRLHNVKGSPADDDIADVLIAHNSIEGSGQHGVEIVSPGINDVVVEGNRIKGFAIGGITCMGGAKRVHVSGNAVYRGAGHGIRIAGADGGSCDGNQVYDDRSPATQTYGIALEGLRGVWAFRDNTAWGHASADYDLHPGSHSASFDGPYRTLFGTAGWNPPPVPDGGVATTTLPVDGASVGDPCSAGLGSDLPAGAAITASVTSANTVGVTLLNRSGGIVDVTGTVWVHVQKPPPLP
ncbi:MAG TPA: right-handed parallel beta-helix repeat-containing protein [Thermoleophilaceae bacterium]|nr:right-handed parallel beta-helix repeat-containing protein [Thermoleophilaceae bacterium]